MYSLPEMHIITLLAQVNWLLLDLIVKHLEGTSIYHTFKEENF